MHGRRLRFLIRSIRGITGIAAALLCLELGLRVFSTATDAPPPRILADSLGGEIVERRQLQEDVSTYRFSPSGARLTGNQPAGAGVNAVILGDSYVVAAEVGDRRTMGARLETLARRNGLPLDVRQYGWSNATPAQYLFVAGDVSRRWNAKRIFIVVSENDMDYKTHTSAGARLRVDSNGVRISGAPIDTTMPRAQRSVLLKLMRFRSHLIGLRVNRAGASMRGRAVALRAAGPAEASPDSAELSALPAAVVTALAEAYGSSLTLIFIATPGLLGDSTPSPIEQRFLEACEPAGVDCVSTRQAMVERRARGRLSHGGSTFAIGHGHLNATGHEVVAELMWERLRTATVVTWKD
ncbi:MAG TPA: hypothetical protein VFO55_09875 [Gemmatimonadaceae bacterium]|nr:hypothetical protein [Gemmatimonadaceae bacterium]